MLHIAAAEVIQITKLLVDKTPLEMKLSLRLAAVQ
jgi:hypothetical protein